MRAVETPGARLGRSPFGQTAKLHKNPLPMGLDRMLTQVDYTWHTLIGCLVTVGVGHARARLRV